MTAEREVRQRYPEAYLHDWSYVGHGPWSVLVPLVPLDGSAKQICRSQWSKDAAWADAASRLQSEREDEGGK